MDTQNPNLNFRHFGSLKLLCLALLVLMVFTTGQSGSEPPVDEFTQIEDLKPIEDPNASVLAFPIRQELESDVVVLPEAEFRRLMGNPEFEFEGPNAELQRRALEFSMQANDDGAGIVATYVDSPPTVETTVSGNIVIVALNPRLSPETGLIEFTEYYIVSAVLNNVDVHDWYGKDATLMRTGDTNGLYGSAQDCCPDEEGGGVPICMEVPEEGPTPCGGPYSDCPGPAWLHEDLVYVPLNQPSPGQPYNNIEDPRMPDGMRWQKFNGEFHISVYAIFHGHDLPTELDNFFPVGPENTREGLVCEVCQQIIPICEDTGDLTDWRSGELIPGDMCTPARREVPLICQQIMPAEPGNPGALPPECGGWMPMAEDMAALGICGISGGTGGLVGLDTAFTLGQDSVTPLSCDQPSLPRFCQYVEPLRDSPLCNPTAAEAQRFFWQQMSGCAGTGATLDAPVTTNRGYTCFGPNHACQTVKDDGTQLCADCSGDTCHQYIKRSPVDPRLIEADDDEEDEEDESNDDTDAEDQGTSTKETETPEPRFRTLKTE